MKIRDIVQVIADHAPTGIQEDFDNSGLCVGSLDAEAYQMLICLDVTEGVIDEAVRRGVSLVVSHHPVIFKGLKNLVPSSAVNRILIKAIQNNIAIYSAHTNLDKVMPGVNTILADKIGLTNQEILVPDSHSLLKLVTYVPHASLEAVSEALFSSGAGHIGNYDSCSFQSNGLGSFRGLKGSNPFVGHPGEIHRENETRIEVVVPIHLKNQVVANLLKTHPYEEVAYDLIPLLNRNAYQGLGIVGDLSQPLPEADFLHLLKSTISLPVIRHTRLMGKDISRVALCGGSGSEFLPQAKLSGAQIYLSGDFKYHQFFEAEDTIVIADIGHYESEIFAVELLRQVVTKKLPTFAVHLSELNTNPIKYF